MAYNSDMSTEKHTSEQKSFQSKAQRRRDLAALPIEEKLKVVIKLQGLVSSVGRQAGRAYRKPWEIKERKHSD